MKKSAIVSVLIRVKALPSSLNKNTLYRFRLSAPRQASMIKNDTKSVAPNAKGEYGCSRSTSKSDTRKTMKVTKIPAKRYLKKRHLL